MKFKAMLAASLQLIAVIALADDSLREGQLVCSNLNNPTGIAVQPLTAEVFVSDSAAGRVIRFKPDSDADSRATAISGFKLDEFGGETKYKIGPLGLAFLDKSTLIVGGGDQKDGAELVRIYTLPDDGTELKATEVRQELGPIPAGKESATGEGNFFGVARTGFAIFVTSNGDDSKGWILKASLPLSKSTSLVPFIATRSAVDVNAPGAITVDRQEQLVIGQMGKPSAERDSRLTFYSPVSGQLLMNLKTGLHDIVGLAYSPKTDQLYALDFAWADPKQGGLFRLDAMKEGLAQSVKATKIATLDKPTAMAFAPDGTLYVTVFGTPSDGSTKDSGQVLKFTDL